jgi:hypothetical protein
MTLEIFSNNKLINYLEMFQNLNDWENIGYTNKVSDKI